MKEMEVLTMTRNELRTVLKLWNAWKVDHRVSYAELLMQVPSGKILSAFEHIASDRIGFYHSAGVYEEDIDWNALKNYVYREMEKIAFFRMGINSKRNYFSLPSSLSKELSDEELEELRRAYFGGNSHGQV